MQRTVCTNHRWLKFLGIDNVYGTAWIFVTGPCVGNARREQQKTESTKMKNFLSFSKQKF
jgi:hypothetical protein